MISKWETIEEKEVGKFKIFNLSWIKRQHPTMEKEGDFVVLKSPEWVNIIPITKENNIVFVEQYRHGTDEITLEIPGGLVEENENPMFASQRECLEETGFEGDGNATLLGYNVPNPAFLTNKCYSYVWFNCKKTSKQNLDPHEDINVVEIPMAKVKDYIIQGKIKHSLVLTAFFFYFLRYAKL